MTRNASNEDMAKLTAGQKRWVEQLLSPQVLLTIVIQLTAVIWFLATISGQTKSNTEELARHEAIIQKLPETYVAQSVYAADQTAVARNIKDIRDDQRLMLSILAKK